MLSISAVLVTLLSESTRLVIEATKFIEVHGFAKEGDFGVPVLSFAELIELYKSKNGL